MKVFIFILGISLLALLTFTLSKSWVIFERGIQISVEESQGEETLELKPSGDSLKEAKVIWKNFIYYPTDLSREDGNIGFDKTLNHATNLTFVNLTTGKLRRLFDRKVYIYDFLPGDFSRNESILGEADKSLLDIGNKFILIVMTQDTNKDGYLNQRDRSKVYLYDPGDEKLSDILPENFYFERLFLNTKKNTLALFIRKEQTLNEKNPPLKFFIYDTQSEKGILVDEESILK